MNGTFSCSTAALRTVKSQSLGLLVLALLFASAPLLFGQMNNRLPPNLPPEIHAWFARDDFFAPEGYRSPLDPGRSVCAPLPGWSPCGCRFAGRRWCYEVAEDTMMFTPADYVDISNVESRRRAPCYAHASQQPDEWYPKQVEITRFRGAESGFAQAEGFLRHRESKRGLLP